MTTCQYKNKHGICGLESTHIHTPTGNHYCKQHAMMMMEVQHKSGLVKSNEREREMGKNNSPTIVCLCGSTRFGKAFQEANLRETLAGHIVLSIGCDMKSDDEIWKDKTPEELDAIKANLDRLHLHKIKLADEVLILNVGGYIGESTKRELEFAQQIGKTIRFLE